MAVGRRRVWYFHGFDPASTARYRRIFLAASERLGVGVSDLEDGDGWRAERDGVVTDLRYLRYEDLVRRAQAGGLLMRLGRGLRVVVGYAMDGAGRWLGWATWMLGLSPMLVAMLPFLVVAPLRETQPLVAGAVLFALLALALVLLLRQKMLLASDLFAYMRGIAGGDERFAGRVATLAEDIEDGADETLIVGHSLGGVAAIHAVARLLERPGTGRLGLLTLGSVHGLVLAQKGAGRDALAAAIARVAGDARVLWVDVSAPRDVFCVALTDPLLMIGDVPEGARSPRVISARLARAPAIPGDRRAVFPAMRRHMGYLLAPQAGSGFDYAETVTGPLTLEERFGSRGNSPKARMWQAPDR